MGKKAKAHRKKVQKRNLQIKDTTRWVKNQEKRILMDLIEREIKNGQYDSNFMQNMGVTEDVVKKVTEEELSSINESESNDSSEDKQENT